MGDMTDSRARPFQFAGSWYPETLEEAESYWTPVHKPIPAKALIVPHSAWLYSGRVAGVAYGKIQPADTFVVIGTNHTGQGRDVSVYPRGRWFLPETKIEIDEGFSEELQRRSEYIVPDYEAHAREHSIEVQVPFLLLLNPAAKLVPILMKDSDPETFHDVGRSIAEAVKKHADQRVVVVASSDFSHFEQRRIAARQDQDAIDRILALDPDGLKQIVDRQGITICGVGPIAATLVAARALGAQSGEQLAYATSGDLTHDDDAITSYAGIVIR
jgi:AmmeMemoRadiSam system protein B